MREKMKLIKLSSCWADEFDVDGFAVYSNDKYYKWLKLVDMVEFPAEWYFGTNEALEWETKEDFMCDVHVEDICDDDARAIIDNFGTEYGLIVCGYDELAEKVCQDLSDDEMKEFDKEFYPEECED
jgi:hypothetical protein